MIDDFDKDKDVLISKLEAIDLLEKNRLSSAPHIDTGIVIAIRVIRQLPPVQRIIRCKDCRYLELSEDGFLYCRNFGHSVTEKDFCSYAERIE